MQILIIIYLILNRIFSKTKINNGSNKKEFNKNKLYIILLYLIQINI